MMLDFHKLDLQTLIYSLTGIVIFFSTAIWYVMRKEKEAEAEKSRFFLCKFNLFLYFKRKFGMRRRPKRRRGEATSADKFQVEKIGGFQAKGLSFQILFIVSRTKTLLVIRG